MTPKYTSIEKASDLKPEAFSVLFELDQNYFPTPWSRVAWDKIIYTIGDGERLLLLVEGDGVIMGFALFDSVSADSFAHLLKIVVNPNVRGMGLGKNLLNESIRLLGKRCIKSFFLEVEEHNIVALNLYELMGFKVIHRKKQFYSSGATALIMTLSI